MDGCTRYSCSSGYRQLKKHSSDYGIEVGQTERQKRTRLLLVALDNAQALANDRARSTDSKAGFLAVTAGILVTTGIWNPHANLGWWVTLIPLTFALLAIGCSCWSLKVRGRTVTEPQALADLWLKDDARLADDLAELLVQAKARDTTALESSTTQRIKWIKYGFYSLLTALVATFFLYVVENSIR